MLLLGSFPLGKVEPAGVISTPISSHKLTTFDAIGLEVEKAIK